MRCDLIGDLETFDTMSATADGMESAWPIIKYKQAKDNRDLENEKPAEMRSTMSDEIPI